VEPFFEAFPNPAEHILKSLLYHEAYIGITAERVRAATVGRPYDVTIGFPFLPLLSGNYSMLIYTDYHFFLFIVNLLSSVLQNYNCSPFRWTNQSSFEVDICRILISKAYYLHQKAVCPTYLAFCPPCFLTLFLILASET
jgi:hypothetical protein